MPTASRPEPPERAGAGDPAPALALQMLRSQAHRERAAGRLLNGALPLVPERWRKLIAWHAREEEEHYAQVAAVWSAASGEAAAVLDRWVAARLVERPLPPVTSFLELAMAQFLFDRAGAWQLREYTDSSFAPYRQLARAILDDERGHEELGARLVIELASAPGARPTAQAAFARWLAVSLLSFGRPGGPRNRAAIDAGLKRRDSAEVARDFIADVAPVAAAAGLVFPPRRELGVELPPDIGLP